MEGKQDIDIAVLQEKVETLEERLIELEKRLDTCVTKVEFSPFKIALSFLVTGMLGAVIGAIMKVILK